MGKIIVVALVVVLLWTAYQKRYVWFVRKAPHGATRAKLSHNYAAQEAFLRRLAPEERTKLVAFLYALTGHDSLGQPVSTAARHRNAQQATDVIIKFRAVFGSHGFSFDIQDARAHTGHYGQMCTRLSGDVKLLQIYLRHREYISTVASDVRNQDIYGALRDIMPSEVILQQLWVADLQRP